MVVPLWLLAPRNYAWVPAAAACQAASAAATECGAPVGVPVAVVWRTWEAGLSALSAPPV